jgi:ribosomal protein S18 acetylase RimI-like enzyme
MEAGPDFKFVAWLNVFRENKNVSIFGSMNITYKINQSLSTSDIIDVYRSSGLNRPIEDAARIEKMFVNSNLVISAWDGERLVGVSRSLTDWSFCCYLSDLAVHKDYQHSGIGRELVRRTREATGEQCMLLLLAAPAAVDYYPKLNMEHEPKAFIYKRLR